MTECLVTILYHFQDPQPEGPFTVKHEGHAPGAPRLFKQVEERQVSPDVRVQVSHKSRLDGPVTITVSGGPFAGTIIVMQGEHGSRLISLKPPISLNFDHSTRLPATSPTRRI